MLVGCQQPSGSVTPFGVTVSQQRAAETVLPAALTGGQPMPTGSYVSNELIVQLSADADAGEVLEGFTRLGELTFTERFAGVKLPDGMSLSTAHDVLSARPGVTGVSLNLVFRGAAPEPPTPVRLSEQWGHRVTETSKLWQDHDRVDASDVVVAVVDSGIAPGHPEFAGRILHPQNFTTENGGDPTDPTDGNHHGTHVAGIIGAAGIKVVGVAPDVKLLPVKALDNANSGTTLGITQGMAYAMGLDPDDDGPRQALPTEVASRVRVMNMSLGSASRGRNSLYESALAEAKKRGILVVVAAGNDGLEVANPANSPLALSVSSTSPYRLGDRIWEWLSGFSNRGERIDLAAPGGQILSTLPDYPHTDGNGNPKPQEYGNLSGTSMAAPYIAGVAALVMAQHSPQAGEDPEAYVDAIKEHLYATADDLGAPGRDPKYGWGRINTLRAVTTPYPAKLTQ
jgi:subtilisin family serine protease